MPTPIPIHGPHGGGPDADQPGGREMDPDTGWWSAPKPGPAPGPR